MRLESWCGPQHSGREKDLRMQAWTSIHWQRERPAHKKARKDSAELRTNESPIPSPSDSWFHGAFVPVPRRTTEPLRLRHCHTKILPVQTKMSHAMTEVCNILCTYWFQSHRALSLSTSKDAPDCVLRNAHQQCTDRSLCSLHLQPLQEATAFNRVTIHEQFQFCFAHRSPSDSSPCRSH